MRLARSRLGLALLLCTAGLAHAAGEGNFALRWPNRLYVWYYNPANEPAFLPSGTSLRMLKEAAAGWAPCGFELRYGGPSDKSPGEMDGHNVIGWKIDGKSHSAWTSWRARRNGPALEADITFYANIFEQYKQRGIDSVLELRKSMIHEFGHVLGLAHSTHPSDVMSVRFRTQPEWKLPSDNDLQACLNAYPPPLPPY